MMSVLFLLLAHTQYDKNLGRIEKWVVRKAFDDDEHPYLPKVKTSPEMLVVFTSLFSSLN
jgi:hypothetical protein